MKYWLGLLLWWIVAAVSARGDDLALRLHCSGAAQLTADTNLATLNQALSSETMLAFERVAADQLSALWLQSMQLGTNAAPIIGPLLADVVKNESVVAIDSRDSNPAGFLVGTRATSDQVTLWKEALEKAFGGAGEQSNEARFKGSRWDKGAAGTFWLMDGGGWLLFGHGNDIQSLRTEYMGEILKSGAPVGSLGTNWLEGDLDLGLLRSSLPEWAKLLKPARLHIQVAPRGNDLEIRGRAVYASEIPVTIRPWQPPKGLVKNPLISFTAGQDIGALLQLSPALSVLNPNPFTNELYAWALGLMPLQSYAAWPVTDATNALKELTARLPPICNPILEKLNGSKIQTRHHPEELVWTGLNVVAPTITMARDNQRDYLFLLLFPHSSDAKPAPAGLWKELESREKLIYYDWELTGLRLQQMRLLPQMLFFHRGAQAGDASIGELLAKDAMLGGLSQKIGATVTEVSQAGTNELFIIRKGPIGFTGFEIVKLADWLSNAASN